MREHQDTRWFACAFFPWCIESYRVGPHGSCTDNDLIRLPRDCNALFGGTHFIVRHHIKDTQRRTVQIVSVGSHLRDPFLIMILSTSTVLAVNQAAGVSFRTRRGVGNQHSWSVGTFSADEYFREDEYPAASNVPLGCPCNYVTRNYMAKNAPTCDKER